MSFTSTPNTTNIRLGTCKVRYKGADLGYTMGGVEVEVTTNTHETKVDQFGDVVANEFIQGRNITVKVPMSETTLDNMVKILPGASYVTDGVKASGTMTVVAVPAADETITINGQDITFKAASPNHSNFEVLLGADEAETAQNIADLINQAPAGSGATVGALANLSATVAGAVVTVTYNVPGVAGNAVTLADGTTGDITMSGANLASGAAPTTTRVEVATGIGYNMLQNAGELFLHPIALADTDVTEDLVIPLAATAGAMNFAFKYDEERVFNVEFKGYPNADGMLFFYGDRAA